jgi:LysR family transcriptional regulator, nod-box dependent transcriptional activator
MHAESFVQPVLDCLLQIQRTVESRMEFNPATSIRKFFLAVSEYTTAVLMSQALRDIAKMAPGITFELARLDETNEQKLEKGEIDFLIRPTANTLAMHPKEPLFEDTHTCVVWSKSSFVGNTISPKKFFKMGRVAAHFGYSEKLEDWFARHYRELLKVEVGTQDFETACRLIVGTNRIATVMSRMARLCAEHLPIRLIRPPFAIPPVMHCLQ